MINPDALFDFVYEQGFDPVLVEEDTEITIACPLCGDEKRRLYISVETGTFICFHCHEEGSLHRFLLAVCELSAGDAVDISRSVSYHDQDTEEDHFAVPEGRGPSAPPPPTTLRLPPEFRPIDRDTPVGYVRYLESRRISPELAAARGLGYCLTGRYARRIVVPVQADGVLYTFIGRTILSHCPYCGRPLAQCSCDSEYPRVLTPTGKSGARPSHTLYNLDAVRASKANRVLVMEGWGDALRRPGEAVGLLGSSASATQLNLLAGLVRGRELILCLDGDEAGYRGALKIAEALISWAVAPRVALLPNGTDPGGLDPAELERHIQAARKYVV